VLPKRTTNLRPNNIKHCSAEVCELIRRFAASANELVVYWSGAKLPSTEMDAPIAGTCERSSNDGDWDCVCATAPFRSSKALSSFAVSHINCRESVSLVMASHNSCQLRVSTLIVAELLSQIKKRSQPASSAALYVMQPTFQCCSRPKTHHRKELAGWWDLLDRAAIAASRNFCPAPFKTTIPVLSYPEVQHSLYVHRFLLRLEVNETPPRSPCKRPPCKNL
jgi:hypothetical protein